MKISTFSRTIIGIIRVLLGRRFPLRVTQVITYRCNLDCCYCARHWEGGHELSTQEVCRLMESFRMAGCLSWSFNGGEPLIRPDIGELISSAKSLGLQVSVNTNGSLVARRIKDLKNVDLIAVSVDGPKPVHDRLRRGSFDSLVSGLKALRDSGIKTTLGTVIAAHNLDCLEAILELASDFKAMVVFQPIRVQNEDKLGKARYHFPERADMAGAMEYLVRAKGMGWPVANSVRYLRLIQECWPDRMPPVTCWAGKLYCFITPEGYATACCDTLAKTQPSVECNVTMRGSGVFWKIPAYQCRTCFSGLPLEANIAIDALKGNPLPLLRQLFSLWALLSGRVRPLSR